MQRPISFDIPSPISILPYNTNHPIYSLRATAEASTPSASSIDTPVQDRFVVQPTPITADESCQGYSYSGQAVHPCQCMPSDPLDSFPWTSSSSKPCLNGEGAICGYQAPPPALLNPHRVMCKLGSCCSWHVINLHAGQPSQHPSLAYSTTNPSVHSCPRSSGPPVFIPRTCHAQSLTLAPASHVYPPPPFVQHHRHAETTMNVNIVYDLTTSSTQTSTTTMTVLQNGLASSANASAALAPDHCPPYAPTRYAPHHYPIVRSRLTSNGWQPPNTSSCHPFPSYVAPVPPPTSPVPSVPLYHPKPVHPLPEWTKKSSLVLDELFCEESLKTDSSTILAHGVPPLPSGTDASSLGEYWNYGAPIASAAIEEMIDPQDSSRNGDDYDDFDEDEDDNDDDEYDNDEDTDMEGDFEMEVLSGTMPEFHGTPSDRQAPFCGTLSSAAVPLSSSSLLCQPLPGFVQNQFRPSAA